MRKAFIAYVIALHVFCLWITRDYLHVKAIQYGLIPLSDCVWAGDSITFDAPTACTKIAIPGLTTTQLAAVLSRYTLGQRPVHLLIGINDLLRQRAPDFAAVVAHIDGPITWSAIMPTDNGRVTHESMARANDSARRLCAMRPDCRFIDTASLGGEDFRPDGLHLSPLGYQHWMKEMERHVRATRAP